jgi:hypothetical protein
MNITDSFEDNFVCEFEKRFCKDNFTDYISKNIILEYDKNACFINIKLELKEQNENKIKSIVETDFWNFIEYFVDKYSINFDVINIENKKNVLFISVSFVDRSDSQ